MISEEQARAAKDAFFEALPEDAVGMCVVPLFDSSRTVSSSSNVPDITTALSCLSVLVANIRQTLDLPEEFVLRMLSVVAVSVLGDLYPQAANNKDELGVRAALGLFAGLMNQFPNIAGICAATTNTSEDVSACADQMSRRQAVHLCADCILDILAKGIVPSQDCDEFLADIRQSVQRKQRMGSPQRSVRRRPRKRGGSSLRQDGQKK